MSECLKLVVKFLSKPVIAKINNEPITMQLKSVQFIRSQEYTGETTVTPNNTVQTLATKNKLVTENITVEAVVTPDQSDATITADSVFKDEIGYNDYNKVIGTYDADLELIKSYQNLYINLNGGSVLTENEYLISKTNCYNLINTLFGGTI